MFLDEKLVQIELKRTAKSDGNEELEKMKAEIIRQEREQKTILDFIYELRSGKMIVEGLEFPCEKRTYFNQLASLYICQDDLEKIIENEQGITVIYKTLEMGVNLTIIKEPMVIKSEKEYQKKMSEHLRQNNVPYYPVTAGKINSGKTKVFYASGITTSPIGGIYTVHFYYKRKGIVVIGNYSCRLLSRYFYEHLFLAMLQLICEEES